MENININQKSKNINIAKIMTPLISTSCLKSEDSVRNGLEILKHHGYTAMPVVDDNGVYYGCVTEGDFLRHILNTDTTKMKEHEKYKIKDICRQDFCRSLKIYADNSEIVSAILEQNFIPIVDDRDCLCGIVTRKSVINCLWSLI